MVPPNTPHLTLCQQFQLGSVIRLNEGGTMESIADGLGNFGLG